MLDTCTHYKQNAVQLSHIKQPWQLSLLRWSSTQWIITVNGIDETNPYPHNTLTECSEYI